MLETAFAIPGDLDAPTGGYAYARRMLALLPRHGVRPHYLPLPGSFPHPDAADLAETRRRLQATPPGTPLLIDGLAYGALPADLIAALERPIVALVHHPLGLEAGLAPEQVRALLASERTALALARAVVATSPFTRALLAGDLGVPAERITVAEPGTEPAPRALGTGVPVALLAVGAVSPRKGYGVLLDALETLPDLDWRLTIAGALDRNPDTAEALRAKIAGSALASRVHLAGAVDDAALAALFAAADVFVSASLFEGYGMVLAEALARGLPLVASTGGAAAETVPDAGALKVPPGDAAALAAALRRMIGDPALRRAHADAAWRAGQALPRWDDAAARIAAVLKTVALEKAA